MSVANFVSSRPRSAMPFVLLALGCACLATAAIAQPESSTRVETEKFRAAIERERPSEFDHHSSPSLNEGVSASRATRTHLSHAALGMTRTVSVDCKKNQSIQKALETKADDLIIEIAGICDEDVEIARDRVTLIGQDPSLDGIRATPSSDDPRQSALLIRNARSVRIENLSFEGSAWNGVRISNSVDGIDLVNVTMTANTVRGLTLIDSAATVTDAVITGNGDPTTGSGSGVYSFGSSILVCERCTIADNAGLGQGIAAVIDQGEATFRDSSLSGSTGIRAAGSGQAFFEDGSIDATTALLATESSSIVTSNSVTVGRILAAHTSRLNLHGGTHTDASPTIAFDDAYVALSGRIDATVTLVDFARARLTDGADVVGVACIDAAQAACSFGSVVGSSSCGGCPVP